MRVRCAIQRKDTGGLMVEAQDILNYDWISPDVLDYKVIKRRCED